MLLKHAKTDHAIGDLISQHEKKKIITHLLLKIFSLLKKKKKVNTLKATQSLIQKPQSSL